MKPLTTLPVENEPSLFGIERGKPLSLSLLHQATNGRAITLYCTASMPVVALSI